MNAQSPASAPELSFGVRLFRKIGRPAFRLVYRVLARPTIQGRENIPERGPYLITANHPSLYDPPLLLAFWPYAAEALGAATQMDRVFIGHIMRWYGTQPVRRDAYDRSTLRAALAVLRAGAPLLIAPEGGRSPDGLREAHPGAAYLAVKANVPVLPVGIAGSEKIFQTLRQGHRQAINVVIGRSYELPRVTLSGTSRKQVLHEYTQEIMCQIAQLLPIEYRGVYAQYVRP